MQTVVFHLMPYRDTEPDGWPFAGNTFDPQLGAQYYEEYLDQLAYAEELGFDAIGFNEHHYNTYGLQPSPNITAAHMAARTDEITLALFGNVLPIRRNPVRLAEELAMLDNLSEGRIIAGFPRGIPSEYLAYNISDEHSRERHAEALDLIRKTWTAADPFDWEGEHFAFENVYAWPRPYQDPHPELWMPATSEPSLRLAAERRMSTGTVGPEAEDLRETWDTYRTFAEEEGWTVTEDDLSVIRRIYVAETTEQAHAEARDHLTYHQQTLLGGSHLGTVARQEFDECYDPDRHDEYVEHLPQFANGALDFDYEAQKDADNFLIGDPESVTAEIERQYEVSGGFGTLVGGFHFGDLPPDLMRKSMRLYADEVMPEIRRL